MYKSDLWANRFLMESVFPSTKWKIRLMTSEVSSFPMDVNSPWQGSSRCLGRLSSSWTPYLQGLARVWHIVGKHDICSFDEWVNFLFFLNTPTTFIMRTHILPYNESRSCSETKLSLYILLNSPLKARKVETCITSTSIFIIINEWGLRGRWQYVS